MPLKKTRNSREFIAAICNDACQFGNAMRVIAEFENSLRMTNGQRQMFLEALVRVAQSAAVYSTLERQRHDFHAMVEEYKTKVHK